MLHLYYLVLLEEAGFVLFNDTWSQQGHSVSCVTILLLNFHLPITRSDIRPHIKWAVSLVIAYGHFNLSPGFVWVNILTLSPLREEPVNMHVHVYTQKHPECSAVDCTITPLVLEHTLTCTVSSGENSAHFLQQQPIITIHFLFSQVLTAAGWTEAAWNETFA